jgi:hypothetical protein
MVGRMTGSMVGGMTGPLTRRKGGGFEWYPNRLFQPGDILLWYDPSDLTTMFQDGAGTSPVTADGQSVLLMLDKGQWGGKTLAQVLAAQAELVADGGFDAGITGWSASRDSTISHSSGKLRVTNGPDATSGTSDYPITTVAGVTYRITVDVGAFNELSLARVRAATGTGLTGTLLFANDAVSTGTSVSAFFTAQGATTYITLGLFSGTLSTSWAEFDNISVREIPGYHRVQATPSQAPKYKTDGTLHWLLYDGTDDGAVTPTINWGTDEVAICAGVTKSSDAAAGAFAELSATSASNNGTFAMLAPASAAANYYWRSKGTGDANMTVTTYTAPTTNVLTGQGKIATDLATLRADGAQVGTSATDQGTGNYGNYPLYFGRRGGASLPFNGKEHQTVIGSRLLSASELAKLETYVAAKTGVIL